MTVSSSTDRATFLGNDATTVFALPFRFFANSEINAWLITNATGALTALTLGTHYTLTGASDPEVDGSATGQLTMITPPTSAQSLFVQRIIPVTQPTDIVNQGSFFPEIHENVFDRLTMLNQQNAGALNRAIRVQDFDPEPAKLPSAVQRALKIMSFDADGNPVAIDAASDSSLVLRQDLADDTDPDKGAALNGRGTVAIASVHELLSAKQDDSQTFVVAAYYGGSFAMADPTTAGGGGLFKWVPNAPRSAHNGGTFFSPTVPWDGLAATLPDFLAGVGDTAPGSDGCFVRIFSKLYVEDFGAVGDGVTLDDPAIRAAIAATPEGGILSLAERDPVYLIDIPAGTAGPYKSAFVIDKPMTLMGNRKAVIRAKPFTTAWSETTSTALMVIRTLSSDVIIDGLVIDCDSDHHYEVDVDTFKWWEAGPTDRKPLDAINVSCLLAQPNVTGCVVRNCIIDRALQGVAVRGAYDTDLANADFIGRTATTGVVVGAQVYGNTVSRGRGNGVIFQSGVYDGIAHGNMFNDMLYHACRIYNTALNTHCHDNHSFMDFDRVAARYNETDLGYFRTNKVGDPQYLLMRQAGFAIGSTYSSMGAALGGNVQKCSMYNNTFDLAGSFASADAIMNGVEASASPLWAIQAHKDITLRGNTINGSATYGATVYLDPLVDAALVLRTNVIIKGNTFRNIRGCGTFVNGFNTQILGNEYINCCQEATVAAVPTRHFRMAGKNNRIAGNTMRAGPQTVLTLPRFHFVLESLNNWIDSNAEIGAFTGNRVESPIGTSTIYGNNAPKTPITLVNGWANFTATPGIADNLGFTISEAGEVEISGFLNGSASTNDVFGTIPLVSAWPMVSKHHLAFIARDSGAFVSGDTHYSVRTQQTDGQMFLQRNGDLPPTPYVNITYRTQRPAVIS